MRWYNRNQQPVVLINISDQGWIAATPDKQ